MQEMKRLREEDLQTKEEPGPKKLTGTIPPARLPNAAQGSSFSSSTRPWQHQTLHFTPSLEPTLMRMRLRAWKILTLIVTVAVIVAAIVTMTVLLLHEKSSSKVLDLQRDRLVCALAGDGQ